MRRPEQIIPVIALLFYSQFVFASINANYKLSNSAKLEWSRSIELEPNPLFMQKGIWFEGDVAGKVFSIWIKRVDGKKITFEDAKKEWQSLIDKENNEGRNFKNKGCINNKKSIVTCEKSDFFISQKNNNNIEHTTVTKLYWNKSSDLIYVKYHLYEHKDLLDDVEKHIHITFGE